MARTIMIRSTLALIVVLASQNAFAQYTKLLNFAGGTEAKNPSGTLVTDGIYLYGVTTAGGTAGMGTIYKTKQDGTGYTKLYDFTGLNGNFPEGSLYYDGTYLYGMTYYGGVNNLGIIYRIMPDGTNYLKLLDFDGANGQEPYGVFVSDGTYLYAMTWKGGANNLGRIFRILPDGTGYQNLLDFAGATNGSLPASSLYFDGNFLYGMTSAGGANGFGTIFKIYTNGTGYDNLYDFVGGTDGREPYGALIGDGTYLYGLTYYGGTSNNGTAFRIALDGTNYAKILDFAGGSGGSHPYTTLTRSGSYLYGLTSDGGTTNFGIMFKVKPDGSGFTRLLNFSGTTSGSEPSATLLAIGPYLYGTTSAGGTLASGTLFRYEVEEPFTKLLDFTGSANGLVPHGALYFDGTFLYGMTEEGGISNVGTIFKIKPNGTEYTKLLDFAGSANGASPKGSLISDGTFLYGMTSLGGSGNDGTVFKIMPDGTGYVKLHDFNLLANGVYPESDLYFDGTWLYGMTPFGGANNRGTFFKIMPDGSNYTKLSDFGAPFDGNKPVSSLYYDGTFFYGTTNRGGTANMGTIFKIMPDGSNLTKLQDFGVGTNGRYPEGSFVSDGTYLYSTTEEGGTNNYGSLFKIKPNGTGYTTILNFDNNIYGSSPQATPLLVDGFLYAMAFVGGPNFEGTIFKIKTDGSNFKEVHQFSSVVSGSYPEGNGLITDGTNFYGMTTNGGLNEGTVFRFRDIPANTTIFNFTGTATGSEPTYNRLICDGSNLLGMTTDGGTNNNGTIFKISQDGSSFTKLYDFGLSPDGAVPFGSLYNDGTFLYGMTLRGGTTGDGTIFKIKSDGTGYVKILNFNGVTTGTDPWGAVTSDGTFLYGTTSQGGTSGRGTIFKVLTDGTGFVKLHDFPANSGYSVSDVVLIGTTLYGTTYYGGADDDGTLFKIETDGTGFSTIHEFIWPEGIIPYTGALVYDGTFLYGMTELGGTTDDGTVFKIKPDGTGYSNLHNFQAPTAGIPLGALEMVGSSLYGLTKEGGADYLGTLFQINSDGTGYQTLMEFDGIANGYDVFGTLCHCNGALYGMTTAGGTYDLGTIFKYILPTAAPPALPTVSSFSPTSGPVGTTVTITGTNFSSTPANNIVYFGATQATVSAATATQLTVTVPVGATYEPISVSVGGLMAYSSNPFVLTFAGGGTINACSFKEKTDFTIGGSAEGVALSDIDGDGKADMILTSATGNTVSVYRNTSSSGVINATSFASGVSFTTGTGPAFVAAEDLNGDGKQELVVTDNTAGTISIFENISTSGTIAFSPRVILTTGVNPYRIGIGDLDADGMPDIAVTNAGSSTVSVFRNVTTTTISFDPKVDFATGTNPLGIAIGDMDADGYPDLVISNVTSANASIFRNLGTPGAITASTFAARVDFVTGTTAQDLAVGDLDGDGKLDFIVANQGSDGVSVFRNTSTPGSIVAGSFAARVDFLAGVNPDGVAINDLDGDGKPDIMVVNSTANTISLLKNASSSGAITTSSFATKIDFAVTGTNPNVGAIGDIDGDGKSDIVIPNYSGTTVSVLRNTVSSYSAPAISDINPGNGSVGTPISILGTNFSAAPSGNIVYFGATQSPVIDATPSGLQVSVPIGATYENVSVLVNCFTAYSSEPFVSTFTGSGIIDAATFGTKTDFATGSRPADASLADLDNDGKADIVTVNDLAGTVSLLRNTSSTVGSFSFAPKIDLTAGASSQAMKVGDIDGDGKLDLITVSDGTSQVSVHRNISTVGSLSFQARVSFTTGSTPLYVDFGDLDGDGRTDLAVVNRNSATVSIYRNTGAIGTISFSAKQDFAIGSTPSGVAIGDIDGDGKPEVITANRGSSTVSIFRNISTSGTISLAARVDLASGTGANSVAIGDLDGDGKMDISVANYTARTISLFRNISTSGSITAASFDARADLVNSATITPTYLSLGDVNGDNKADILVGNDAGTLMQVHRNISSPGSLTSSSFAARIDFTTGTRPHNVTCGDLDGDGKPEIVSSNATSNTVSVLHNLVIPVPTITSFTPTSGPAGTTVTITGTNFSATPANNTVYFGAVRTNVTASTTTQLTVTVPAGATFQPISVTVDALTASSSKPFVVTFPGGGNFSTDSFEPKVDFTGGAWSVAVGDFDNDGKADIVSTTSADNTVSVFKNTSVAGAITSGSLAAKLDVTTNDSESVAVGDIDGDGKLDLAVTNRGSNSVSILMNITSSVINFATKVDFTTGTNPEDVAIRDLDGDGKPEVIVANIGSNSISVFKNTSVVGTITAGSFATRVDYSAGTPETLAIADLDGDNKPDIATATDNGFIRVLRNNTVSGAINSASFSSSVSFASGGGPGLAIGDLDGDGKPDLTTANTSVNTFSVLRNTSTSGIIDAMSFESNVDFTTGSSPENSAIADLDGDGKPEVAISNHASATISVFKNTTTSGVIDASSFAAKVDFTTGTVNFHLALADMDGDGKNDLVSANYGDGTISILRNTVTNAIPAIAITVNGNSQADGSTVTFSSLVIGNNETKDFVIANAGTATLNISTISTTGDFAVQGTAPASVNAGEDETVTLQFSPTQSGTRTGTVTFLSDGDVPTYVINLSGSGIAPNPVIEITDGGIGQGSGSDLDFSSTDVGTEALKTIVITNSGNAELVITDIQVTGDFAIEGVVPSSIGPGSSETIAIKFTPTEIGARTGTLTIFSNGDTPVFVLNLAGSGETEIEVYNVVTVNPNGKHDFLKIRNITFFPENKVSLFDRWGNKVFETNKYDNADNVFKGVNEKGKDLPEGTYFYVIYKNNGDKPFTGFIFLRR
jgi:gliding motility-associated-like protein